jgi:hypothetical protein
MILEVLPQKNLNDNADTVGDKLNARISGNATTNATIAAAEAGEYERRSSTATAAAADAVAEIVDGANDVLREKGDAAKGEAAESSPVRRPGADPAMRASHGQPLGELEHI